MGETGFLREPFVNKGRNHKILILTRGFRQLHSQISVDGFLAIHHQRSSTLSIAGCVVSSKVLLILFTACRWTSALHLQLFSCRGSATE